MFARTCRVRKLILGQDAETAIDEGIDGIIVSNHGGRQIDGSISALYALEQVMQSSKVKQAQASGKMTILFDSGVRSGSDMFRAIAIGAQGVLREYSTVEVVLSFALVT